MSYSKLGIINMAIGKLGNSRILASLTEDTAERIAATTVWEYILDEVNEAKEWKFARTSVALDRSDIAPENGYAYGYPLPDDLLRPIKRTKFDSPISLLGYDYLVETIQLPEGLDRITNGAFTGAATGWTLGTLWTYGTNEVSKAAGGVATLSQLAAAMVSAPVVDESYLLTLDVASILGGSILPSVGGTNGNPVSSEGTWKQVIVAGSASLGTIFTPSSYDLACSVDNVSLFKISDRKCLFVDYYSVDNPVQITYIKRITDMTKWPPAATSALAFRLAAEMALKLTEGIGKYTTMMGLYGKALTAAEGINQSFGYLESESGSDEWDKAGRD
jgi:hypothetical protein